MEWHVPCAALETAIVMDSGHVNEASSHFIHLLLLLLLLLFTK